MKQLTILLLWVFFLSSALPAAPALAGCNACCFTCGVIEEEDEEPPFIPTVFAEHDFTGADTTDLTTMTADLGGQWTQHGSFTAQNYQIRENRAATANSASTAMNYLPADPDGADVDVEADLCQISASYTGIGNGIAGRVQTAENTMIFARYSTSGWQVFQTAAGTSTQIGSASSQTLSNDTCYAMRLELRGSSVELFVDDTSRVSGTTTVTAAGKVGLRGNSNSGTTGVRMDNFKATNR